MCIPQRGGTHGRGALVEENGQCQPLGRLIDEPRRRAEWIEALVVRSELDAPQAEIGHAPLDLRYHVALLWMDRHEADEFRGMGAHKRGGFGVDIALPLDARSLGGRRHLTALEADAENA